MMPKKPMNQNENEEEKLDFEKPDFEFKPETHHPYKQQGPYLVCRSCAITHSVWIGIEKVLVGFSEKGEPIIKKKKEVMGA